MIIFRRLILLFLPFSVLVFVGGCATGTTHQSSSVVNYLYPGQSMPLETARVPSLSLPLKVGIAFVPESRGHNAGFTELEKSRLLQEIGRSFNEREFVHSIEIVPSAYLTPAGSFANLDQIRTMYGIDVIALVSYDQTQFTDGSLASFTYWTLIGAYIVPGEKNDTHTMVDAAVYDISSRTMLFRAPGISHIKGRSALVNLSEELRDDSLQGFKEAGKDLVSNLSEQLLVFREKVKEAPEDYQIVHRAGYIGGGSLDLLVLFLSLGFAGCWIGSCKRR